jgi:hypothetical protein
MDQPLNIASLKELDEYRKQFDGRISAHDTDRLFEYARRMESAMAEFVKRCDDGQVRSTYTYSLFKKTLGI